MVVCVECLPENKPWDVVSATRRSSGVALRACVRVYARMLVPPNLYIHTYIHTDYPTNSSAGRVAHTSSFNPSVAPAHALTVSRFSARSGGSVAAVVGTRSIERPDTGGDRVRGLVLGLYKI